jgi:hypothetical protein
MRNLQEVERISGLVSRVGEGELISFSVFSFWFAVKRKEIVNDLIFQEKK